MTLVAAQNLTKWFPLRAGITSAFRREPDVYLRAVDGVNFRIEEGEIFGLVGESGCGKTTTGRLLLRLLEPTQGQITFEGKEISDLKGRELKGVRKRMQIIFQDPYESLNPRKTVYDIVAEPLRIHAISENGGEERMIVEALREVQLTPLPDVLYRFPHELSGGQRQRVAIARTLILKPRFVVADEPVSMLDVSIRTEILNLMLELKDHLGLTYLFITHDLAVAKYMCDRIAVMYLGKIVESGPSEKIIDDPLHPYTKALLVAVPSPDPNIQISAIPIKGEVTGSVAPVAGCIFEPRCPIAVEKCKVVEPELREVRKDRWVACHLV